MREFGKPSDRKKDSELMVVIENRIEIVTRTDSDGEEALQYLKMSLNVAFICQERLIIFCLKQGKKIAKL